MQFTPSFLSNKFRGLNAVVTQNVSQPIHTQQKIDHHSLKQQEVSKFEHLKKTAEKLMREQVSNTSNSKIYEEKLKNFESICTSQGKAIEQLTVENARLVGVLNSEKESYKKLNFELVANQTICSSIRDAIQNFESMITKGNHERSLVEGHIKELESSHQKFVREYNQLSDKLKECERELEERDSQIQDKDEELRKLLASIESQRKEIEELSLLRDTLEIKNCQQREEIANLEREIESKEESMRKLQSEIEALEFSHNITKSQLTACQLNYEEFKANSVEQKITLDTEIERLKAIVEEQKEHEIGQSLKIELFEVEINSYKNSINELSSFLKESDMREKDLETRSNTLTDELSEMQAKIGMYVGKSVELENNLISLQDEYNKLNTSKTEETEKLTKEIQSLENKLATTEQLIKDLNSSVGTSTETLIQKNSQIESLTEKCENLQRELLKVATEFSTSENEMKMNKVELAKYQEMAKNFAQKLSVREAQIEVKQTKILEQEELLVSMKRDHDFHCSELKEQILHLNQHITELTESHKAKIGTLQEEHKIEISAINQRAEQTVREEVTASLKHKIESMKKELETTQKETNLVRSLEVKSKEFEEKLLSKETELAKANKIIEELQKSTSKGGSENQSRRGNSQMSSKFSKLSLPPHRQSGSPELIPPMFKPPPSPSNSPEVLESAKFFESPPQPVKKFQRKSANALSKAKESPAPSMLKKRKKSDEDYKPISSETPKGKKKAPVERGKARPAPKKQLRKNLPGGLSTEAIHSPSPAKIQKTKNDIFEDIFGFTDESN